MNEKIKLLVEQASRESITESLLPAVVLQVAGSGDVFRIPEVFIERLVHLVEQDTIGQITITRSGSEIVAVTLTDEEHRVLRVIWQKAI